MEVELSKLKDKWAEEFHNMSYYFKDNMQTWVMDYVSLNNNISINVNESHDDLIQFET